MKNQRGSRRGFPPRWGPATYKGETFDSPSDLAKFLRLQITGRRDMIDVFECTGKYKVDAVRGQHFIVKNELTRGHVQEGGKTMSEFTVSEELFHVWEEHSEGSKAERSQQVGERIFSLLSLMAIKETEEIFHRLWEIVDFDELYRLSGKLGATGIWGSLDESELF